MFYSINKPWVIQFLRSYEKSLSVNQNSKTKGDKPTNPKHQDLHDTELQQDIQEEPPWQSVVGGIAETRPMTCANELLQVKMNRRNYVP